MSRDEKTGYHGFTHLSREDGRMAISTNILPSPEEIYRFRGVLKNPYQERVKGSPVPGDSFVKSEH
jgi:hypothetical protein